MKSAVVGHVLRVLGCVALTACAARAPRLQLRPPTRNASAGQLSDCRAREEAARAFFASGKIGQAQRKLGDCADDDARELGVRIGALLGEARRARLTRRAPPAPSTLAPVEALLDARDCPAALAAAQQRYQDQVPNPQAAVLAGQAAECLGNRVDAGVWYARALFEAELAEISPSWGVARTPVGLGRLPNGDLIVNTRAGAWRLAGSGARETVQVSPEEPELVWQRSGVRVRRSSSELWVEDVARHAQLWKRPLESEATLVVTSAGLVVLRREDAKFRVQLERIELDNGKSSWKAQARAVQVEGVVSSPDVGWFSFETPEPNERDTSVVMVSEGGGVRRYSADVAGRECRPLAVWSQHEFLSSCGEVGQLWAVDAATSAKRSLSDLPPGGFAHAQTLSGGVVSLSGSGGAALVVAAGQKANIERPAAAADMAWPDGLLWSSDGQRATGLAKQGSRELVSSWGRKTKAVDAIWSGYSEAWPGYRTGVSLAKDRGALVFGDCPAAHTLDLHRALVTTLPLKACGALPGAVRGGFSGEDPARATALLGSDKTLRAVSDGGTRIAFETREEANARVTRNLVVADIVDARLVVRFQTRIHDYVPVLFNRDGSTLLFRIQGSPWQQVDAQSGTTKPATLGADLDEAVELSRDGATLLTASGLINGSRRIRLPYASWKKAEDARGDGLAFADDDRLVVGRSGANVLLWRAADAAYMGRLVALASGDTFFTTAAPSEGSETGHRELVQWWGPSEGASSLRCELGERNYDWQVCADRFSDDGLLGKTLAR